MRLFLFIILSSGLTSCRQSDEIDGNVNDFESNHPLTKVHIYQKGNPQNSTYTDTLGKFKIKKGSFEFFGSSLTIVVEKENYQSKEVTFDYCESEYILLKPIN